MKKVYFVLLAMLAALVVFSCDNAPSGVIGDVGDADGDAITFTIGINGGPGVLNTAAERALTRNNAYMSHDFFEVVFYNGTDYSRASWRIGGLARAMDVPPNYDYGDDGTKAILFVGRQSDQTLLAVGLLTSVNNPGANSTTITDRTTRATFSVASLITNVNHINTAGTGATTFRITEVGDKTGNGSNPEDTEFEGRLATAITPTAGTNGSFRFARHEGRVYPLYEVGRATQEIEAVFNIYNNDTGLGTAIAAKYLNGMIVSAGARIIPRLPTTFQGDFFVDPWHAVSIENYSITNNTGGAAFAPAIAMKFDTPLADALSAFTFEIPVQAFPTADHATAKRAITWYIRPSFGTNTYVLDAGQQSLGGAVLLGIGDVDVTGITIESGFLP